MRKMSKYVEIMDTTLRDGEQSPGIAFSPREKRQIASILLDKVGADRIEIGSALVSEGEAEGAAMIISWAEKKARLDQVEILGFVDRKKSVDWIRHAGGRVINLLCKGSELHCRRQLRKTPEQHYSDVCRAVDYAVKHGLRVNLYLEDWSSGMRDSFHYVHALMKKLAGHQVERVMLPDTLGCLSPEEVGRYLNWMFSAFPAVHFDFHGHNDYGLGTANSLVAVQAGVDGVHVTVNGLGERAGNPSLAEVVTAIHDVSPRRTRVREKQLSYVSEVVQAASGKRLSSNAPVVGPDVFTQTCGVHADGDKKGNLYANKLLPERFGRERQYALGKLSGKASIDKNLETLGLELDAEVRNRVLDEVIRLGDRKKKVTPEDLPYVIADVLKSVKDKYFEFVDYHIQTRRGSLPQADIKLRCGKTILAAEATGDGGYDAFMKAVKKALRKVGLKVPRLLDYEVRIPPGGKTDALVEATINWDNGAGRPPLVTIGIDSDQVEAAIEATEKMLNITLPPRLRKKRS